MVLITPINLHVIISVTFETSWFPSAWFHVDSFTSRPCFLSAIIMVLHQWHYRLEPVRVNRTTSLNQSHVIVRPVAGRLCGCTLALELAGSCLLSCDQGWKVLGATNHSMSCDYSSATNCKQVAENSLCVTACEVAITLKSHDQLPTGPGPAIKIVAACRRFCAYTCYRFRISDRKTHK